MNQIDTLTDEITAFLDRYGEDAVLERVSEKAVMSKAAKISVSRRTPRKKLRPCPFGCGEQFGFKDLRKHMPRCPRHIDRRRKPTQPETGE